MLVTAAAVATLVQLAPGRVNVGIGSGFTGRLAMGQRPNSWTFVAQYIRQLKALLAGEVVEVDGAATRMLQGPGQAPARPIRVPIVVGTGGPKGEGGARWTRRDGDRVSAGGAGHPSGAHGVRADGRALSTIIRCWILKSSSPV